MQANQTTQTAKALESKNKVGENHPPTMTMKMKILVPILSAAIIGFTSAAPAVVWRNRASGDSVSQTSHISKAMDARSLLTSAGISRENDSSSALSAVIFLVGRAADGSEGLISLVSSNDMAGVKDRYLMADEIYYHVHGVESARTVARDARESSGEDLKIAEVSMEEFQRKLTSMAMSEAELEGEGINNVKETSSEKKISKVQQQRRRAISEADVLVVSVANKSGEDNSKINDAIISAIDSPAIRNVILSSIRSTDEVKRARKLAVLERLTKKWSTTYSDRRDNRRRLEDAAAVDNNIAQSESGIYYVNMTPNILAGLLFFLLFVVTAHIGLTCMNMIEGQDVYVKKMPHIGREV